MTDKELNEKMLYRARMPMKNMNLRQWYAGQALASSNWTTGHEQPEADLQARIPALAAVCFEIADAMIAEDVRTEQRAQARWRVAE